MDVGATRCNVEFMFRGQLSDANNMIALPSGEIIHYLSPTDATNIWESLNLITLTPKPSKSRKLDLE